MATSFVESVIQFGYDDNQYTHENSISPQQDQKSCNSEYLTKSSCEESEQQEDNLSKQHNKHNTLEKQFTCELKGCHKTFSRLSSLMKHKRIHEGTKPYRCKICNNTFTQSSNLRRHERIHSGEKPFTCEYCHKSFLTNSNLKQHKMIHTDTRNKYQCKLCDRGYFYKSSLKKHMISHENDVDQELSDIISTIKPEKMKKDIVQNEQIKSSANKSTNTNNTPKSIVPLKKESSQVDNIHKLLETTTNMLEEYKANYLIQFSAINKEPAKYPQQLNIQGAYCYPTDIIQRDYANYNYHESTFYDDNFHENNLYPNHNGNQSYELSQLLYEEANNNNHGLDSNADVLSEMDSKEYKIYQAMHSKNLILIDSDDEEQPIKQIRSAPATFKTENLVLPNELRYHVLNNNNNNNNNNIYNPVENLFSLDANLYSEKKQDLFIIEEKQAHMNNNNNKYFDNSYFNQL